ncbi:MAG: tartrate dehydrogenase, partial [Clostridia bacterium]|nr:tartrate dehydrogenase [Clostridia bacterium]
GKGIANPIAEIWSAANMLKHLGLKHWHDKILQAIEVLLLQKQTLTPDLGGNATTSQVGDALCKILTIL